MVDVERSRLEAAGEFLAAAVWGDQWRSGHNVFGGQEFRVTVYE